MLLADMHVHSNFSDGKMTIPELVDFYGRRGFKVLAVTDHLCVEKTIMGRAALALSYTLTRDSFQEYLEICWCQAERAWSQYGMRLIPGFEISKNSLSNHRSAHILGLGIHQFVSADLSIDEIILAIREQGALCIAAHPVSTRKIEKQTFHLWDRREELREAFDAWEVASGPYWFDEVEAAGLPLIANSDLHVPRQINSWKTLIDAEPEVNSIFAAIREQRLSFTFYQDSVRTDLVDGALGPSRIHQSALDSDGYSLSTTETCYQGTVNANSQL